jgi:hypothetical protein
MLSGYPLRGVWYRPPAGTPDLVRTISRSLPTRAVGTPRSGEDDFEADKLTLTVEHRRRQAPLHVLGRCRGDHARRGPGREPRSAGPRAASPGAGHCGRTPPCGGTRSGRGRFRGGKNERPFHMVWRLRAQPLLAGGGKLTRRCELIGGCSASGSPAWHDSAGRSGSGARHMAVASIHVTDLKREEGAAGLC